MHHDGGTMMEAPSVSRSPQREDQHRFDGRLSAFHVGKDEVAWMGLASCKAATCTSLQKHMSSCLRCWSIHLLTSMWQACLLTSMTFPCSGWLWVPQAHRLSRLWLGAIAMSPICRRQQVFRMSLTVDVTIDSDGSMAFAVVNEQEFSAAGFETRWQTNFTGHGWEQLVFPTLHCLQQVSIWVTTTADSCNSRVLTTQSTRSRTLLTGCISLLIAVFIL